MNKKIVWVFLAFSAYVVHAMGDNPFIINSESDIVKLLKLHKEDWQELYDQAVNEAQHNLEDLLSVSENQRSYKNTIQVYDHLKSSSLMAFIATFCKENTTIHPSEELRALFFELASKAKNFIVENIDNNENIYNAIKVYLQRNNEDLSQEQRYFIDDTIMEFEKKGLSLTPDQCKKAVELQQRISDLILTYDKNLHGKQWSFTTKKEELKGMSDDFINSLECVDVDHGEYKIVFSRSNFLDLMAYCDVEATRKDIWNAYFNRAYPENKEVMEEWIAAGNLLAKIVGYASYAHYDISGKMAQSPERVVQFLHSLNEKLNKKNGNLFENFKTALPDNVTLSEEGKMYPWNWEYVVSQFQKSHSCDNKLLREYFPLDRVINGRFDQLSNFFGLIIKRHAISSDDLWDKNVECVKFVKRENGKILGYLLLDLFPREGKYNYVGGGYILPVTKNLEGVHNPALCIINMNLPKPAQGKPVLLTLDNMTSLFHEMGHVMHCILSNTLANSFSGYNVKEDFIEVPSLLFQRWAEDKDVLESISCHYKTKESVPHAILEKAINSKHLFTVIDEQSTVSRVMFIVRAFKEAQYKDIDIFCKDIVGSLSSHTETVEDHWYASRPSVSYYGPKIYVYRWGDFIAADLFSEIKKRGIDNPEVGKDLCESLLSRGGSDDPYNLVKGFLRREPQQEALCKEWGIN